MLRNQDWRIDIIAIGFTSQQNKHFELDEFSDDLIHVLKHKENIDITLPIW